MGSTVYLAQLVDENDAVLLDFQDPTGVNNAAWGSVATNLRELSLRTGEIEANRMRAPHSSTTLTTYAQDNPAVTSWRQFASATSYENLQAFANRLSWLLRRGTIFKFQETVNSKPGWLDCEPSSALALFGEEPEDMFRALSALAFAQGIPLQVVRQPVIRRAALDSTLNNAVNSTLLDDTNLDGTPDSWTKDAGTQTIDTGSDFFQVSHGSAVDVLHQNFAAAAATQIAVSIEAYVVSGTRVPTLKVTSTPSNAVIGTASIIATSPQSRVSVTGVVAGGDTGISVILTYVGGSGTTVSRWRYCQLDTAVAASRDYRMESRSVINDPSVTGYGAAFPVFNPGSAPSPCQIWLKGDAGAAIAEVVMGLRSNQRVAGFRAVTDYLNSTNYAQSFATGNGWTIALGTNTANVVDAGSSGGRAAQCTFAANWAVMDRRVKATRTTKLDSLRGEFDVYLPVKAAGAHTLTLQLRYGPGTADPVPNQCAEVIHDTTAATAFGYALVKLGRIRLPRETSVALGTLTLELWARQDVAANANFGHFILMPTEQQARITIPAASDDAGTRVQGKSLTSPPYKLTADPTWVAGSASGTNKLLNATNEAAGWGSNAGDIVGLGRHRATFSFGWIGPPVFSAKCRIANVTDNTEVSAVSIDNGTAPDGSDTVVISWDGVAGKHYQPQVDMTAFTSGGLTVGAITYGLVPSIASGEQIRSDPGSVPSRYAVEKLDSSGNLLSDLAATMVPFMVPPGLSIVDLVTLDLPNAGYNENAFTLARAPTVSTTVYPRDFA